MKPFSVWWKRQGKWVLIDKFYSYPDALHCAKHNITLEGITERVEIREGRSAFAIYDKEWKP